MQSTTARNEPALTAVVVSGKGTTGRGQGRGWQRAGWILPLLAGLLLVVMAVPRLVSALLMADGHELATQLAQGKPVAVPDLAAAGAQMEMALSWSASGEGAGERLMLLDALAMEEPVGPARRQAIAAALRSAEIAVAMAPGQPVVWARLSRLREQAGDRAGAVQALRQSFLSGAFIPAIIIPRLLQGIRLADQMDAETLRLFRRQIRLAWVMNPRFVSSLWVNPQLQPLVAAAMDELSELDRQTYFRLRGGEPVFRP